MTAVMPAPTSCLFVCDFTAGGLAGLATNDTAEPKLDVHSAPFGQVLSTLLDGRHSVWERPYDVVVVWTRPEAVIQAFADAVDGVAPSNEALLEQVDTFAAAVEKAASRARLVLLPTWVSAHAGRGFGMLDLRAGGVAAALLRMNLRLAERFADSSNVFMLNAHRWIEAAGSRAAGAKLWYMGKIPFANTVFSAAIRDIKAAVRGASGRARKLIVVDLDDTLWGGIVGDVGWENLSLGGHSAVGEAYLDLQRALRALKRRGILLAIASKNEESVALAAIDNHPEMLLRRGDFVGWRINWSDKAQNIVDLVTELRLGLQSVVFLDDNPVERARVAEALPEVLVPDLPADKMLFASALRDLDCFDVPSVTTEDAQRSQMYVEERERRRAQDSMTSVEDWQRSLGTQVKMEYLGKGNLERTVQLLNKTNQMNLTTRRLSTAELLAWAEQDNHWFRTVRVADRFGDAGLTGIVSMELDGAEARVIDFVLSCRVMGRRIEDIMVRAASDEARAMGADRLVADFIPTAKNKPCFDFWVGSGFDHDARLNRFSWSLAKTYPSPDWAQVEHERQPQDSVSADGA